MDMMMRNRLKLWLACLGALTVASAADAEWKVVSRAFAPQKVSIDSSTIKREGNLVTLWTKVTPPPALAGTDDAAAQPSLQASSDYTEGLPYLMQVSCSDRLIRLSTGQIPTEANPFGPANASPYTFQPLNTPVAYAVYAGACLGNTPVAPVPVDDDYRRNITPRRTAPRTNPWPYMANRGY
jgi:hypothetical protein